jgi:phospholipid/cholesterol/gamma-HCH transport system substrate-binding protein
MLSFDTRRGRLLGSKVRAGDAPRVQAKTEHRVGDLQASSAFGRVIALVALVVAAVVIFLLLSGGDSPYRVTAEFENASQLVKGNEVVVGGTPVGSIEEIELGDDGQALITFSVQDEYAPLARGTTATVRSPSLSSIAGRQIELALPPPGEAGEEIEDGGTLDQSETVSAVDLDEIFNTLDTETVADLKKVIRGFELSYDGVGEQANKGFVYLNPFLSTSRRLFAELTTDERALEQLIVDGAKLSGAVAEKRDDVAGLVSNLNTTMGALANQRTALASAISRLPAFMRDFNTTAVNLRATLDDLDPLVDASKPAAIELQPFFAEFRGAARNLVPTVRDLDQVIKSPGSNNDLVDLTRLQTPLSKIAIGPIERNGEQRAGAFPESVQSLNDSLRQLAFFRAYTPELVGWFNDFGTSGVIDGNGGIGRIATTFNAFSVSQNGLPNLPSPLTLLSTEQFLAGLSTDNLQKCPGANERPAPDGSNPFTDGGTLDCDPSEIPPGN